MEIMTIPMHYCYKESTNYYLYLIHDINEGTITIKTSYNETVAVVTCGDGLIKVLTDLKDNKYMHNPEGINK